MDRIILATIVVVTGCLLGGVGYGYPTPVDFNGKLSRWDIVEGDIPISFAIDGDESFHSQHISTIAEEAASIWSRVPTSYIELERISDVESAQIVIKLTDEIEQGSSSSGYSEIESTLEDGMIHCTMTVATNTSYVTIAKTLLHEFGHCLGLGHTLMPEAIMSYSVEQNSFSLSIDDVAAVTRLYPINGGDPQLPKGCAVMSRAGVGNMYAGVLLCLPLVFALCWLPIVNKNAG